MSINVRFEPRAYALASLALLVAASAGASSWKVETAKSSLEFSGTQSGSPFKGRFARFQSDIAFDPAQLGNSHIIVTVEAASAATGNPQTDNALPGKDWLDVKEYPKARFASKSIQQLPSGEYEVVGELTLRGVTKPLTVKMSFSTNGDGAELKGQTQVVRTDFGVGQGSWSSPDMVSTTIDVSFDLNAKRGP